MSQNSQDKDLTLQFVQIIARHGLRAPLTVIPGIQHKSTNWKCTSQLDHFLRTFEFFIKSPNGNAEPLTQEPSKRQPVVGNCYGGQLTEVGLNQMESLGKTLRKMYINQSRFLDQQANPKQLFIRSTHSRRTMESAQSAFYGMYPDLATSNVILPIFMHPREEENMYARSSCTNVHTLRSFIKSHPEWIAKQSEIDHLRNRLHAVFKEHQQANPDEPNTTLPTLREFAGVQNTLHTMEHHGLEHPTGITKEILKSVEDIAGWEGKIRGSKPEIVRLSVGRFINDFVTQMDQKIKAETNPSPSPLKDLKFAYYSGHDNTLIPMLNGFQIHDSKHPPMGSHMIFELYKENKQKPIKNQDDFFVRVLYNFKEMQLPECQKQQLHVGGVGTVCPYSVFRKIADDLIPKDYEKDCGTKKD